MQFFSKIILMLDVSSEALAKKILHHPFLTAAKIASCLDAQHLGENNGYREKVVLDLGEINEKEFSTLFPKRLKQSWHNFLLQNKQATALTLHNQETANSTHSSLPPGRENVRPVPDADEIALFNQACSCLQTVEAPKLIPHALLAFHHSQWSKQAINYVHQSVSANQLAASALAYLLSKTQGISWLGTHTPTEKRLNNLIQAVASGEIAPLQVKEWFPLPMVIAESNRSAVETWLLPLWQHPQIHAVLNHALPVQDKQKIAQHLHHLGPPPLLSQSGKMQHKQASKPAPLSRQATPSGHKQTQQQKEKQAILPNLLVVSNAGIVLLWPLLPALFNTLELITEQKFTNTTTQWQAALALDWLAWGNAAPAERLTLSMKLSGLKLEQQALSLLTLTFEQQTIIDNWLNAIGQQLPSWQKLSINDIRQLWLQRPGLILSDNPLHLEIKSEPYDILLNNWPWPLSILTLPWLDEPITLEWLATNKIG